jgi:DnaJ-class molecular chaperone
MCDACHGAGVVKTGMVTCGQCRGQGYRYDATIVFYPRKYGLFDDNNAYGAGERSVEKDCTIDEVEDLKKGYKSFSYNTWVSKVDRDAGYKSDLFISRKVCTMCSGKEQLVKNAPCPTCQGDKTIPVLTLSAR